MRLLRNSAASDKAGSRAPTFIALATTAVAGLAACSSTPKALNPVELYRSAAGFTLNDDTSGERNAQNLAAGSNEPYPNLGTVPPPPDRAMSSIDRRKLQQGLTEDRTEAKQSDADLRGSGTASGTAMAAPTPITPPSPAGGAAAAETKHEGDPSLPGAHTRATGAHRAPAGSEPAPQESALNSPDVHALPEGDTPRPAPPPPYLPPPEKARKPAHAAKPAQGGTAAKRPSPAPQRAAKAAVTPPAEPAIPIPPPPPATDMMSSTPGKMAVLEPVMPPPSSNADPASAPPPASVTPLPPAPDATALAPPATAAPPQAAPAATARDASSPAPLAPADTQKPPSQQTTLFDPVPPPSAAPIPVPVPAPAKVPDQQAALEPAPAAVPTPPAAKIPGQQAALETPAQATPPASRPDQAMAEPVPQRAGRGGTVSLQAAEIDFADNGLTLTAEDDQRLASVVKLYDKHGGIVRVVGYGRRGFGADAAQQELASFSKAIERANVVARALAQLGLASNRIVVQAAPVGDGLGEDRAEVLLEF